MNRNPFKFQVTPHLEKLAKKSPAVRKQFYEDPRELRLRSDLGYEDPLIEQKYTPVKGLIHKYPGRVLVVMTSICSAYCRFCDRKRLVGDPHKGLLTDEDLDRMATYIVSKKEVREVIFNGGDPLINGPLLAKCLKKFGSLPQIKILRIHTRMPVSDPSRTNLKFLETAKTLSRPLYVGIHFNHPDEITKETVEVCDRLRSAGCILYSHTVFLKEVNDDVETLEKLFNRLLEIGVRPYYLLRCEPIRGGKHFIVEFDCERKMATELRRRLSGLACPLYVIDTPQGSGKIPVPLEFWHCNYEQYRDFEGKTISSFSSAAESV